MSEPVPHRRPSITPEAAAVLDTAPARPVRVKRQDQAPPADDGHFLDYVRIVYKRRWTALTAFVVVCGSMALYTSRLTPIYTARVQLLIENETPNVVKFEEVYEQNKATSDYYQTQYRILQSRLIARRTIESQQLWNHPLLRGTAEAAPPVAWSLAWIGGALDSAASLFRWPTAEVPPHEQGEDAGQAAVVDLFLSGLNVIPVRNSRLVDVTFESPDAMFAASTVNALANEYIEQTLEFRFLATKEATEFLTERAAEQRKSLEKSERALQEYREKTGAIGIEDRENIVVQRLADLSAAVTRARTDRIEKESLFSQIQELQNDRAALDTFPSILGNTFIQQLKVQLNELQRQRAQLGEKLGARHPDMTRVQSAIDATEARLNTEVQKVVQALRNDFLAAQANERALQRSLDQQRRETQELNRAAVKYGALERDAATNQTMFAGLLQRSRETDIASELRTSNIRIVDAAETPRSPSNPNLRRIATRTLLAGLLAGLCLAFFFESLDGRIKEPDEIKTVLGLPFLGMVPAFRQKEIVGPPLLDGMPSDFGEAFRAIRTNLIFASASPGPKSLLVTSTGPGEGKSVVSANIAVALAQSGLRVLLIDADMRRPKIHEFFAARREPGLSNVLVANAKASDAVRETKTPNLWLLPCGKLPPNPAELLGSARLVEFLRSLDQHFDWVVIDSPPVMAVTDPGVLAHNASGVVFVVGCEMTNRYNAQTALEQLDAAQPRYFGAILNRVDVRRNPYFYSRHYRREYQKYYTKKQGA